MLVPSQMVMLEIRYYVSQKTIELESDRIADMDEEDFRWCFAAQIDFITNDAEKPKIRLPEVGLLDLALQLANVSKEICEAGFKTARIEDMEGMYSLDIVLFGEDLRVHNAGTNDSFEIGVQTFQTAITEFIKKVVLDMPALFPLVQKNPHFEQVVSRLN